MRLRDVTEKQIAGTFLVAGIIFGAVVVLALAWTLSLMKRDVEEIRADITEIIANREAVAEQAAKQNREIVRTIRKELAKHRRHNQTDHNKLKQESRFIVRFIRRFLESRGFDVTPFLERGGGGGSPKQQ